MSVLVAHEEQRTGVAVAASAKVATCASKIALFIARDDAMHGPPRDRKSVV